MNSPRRPCGSGRGIAASPWCSSIGPWCRHPGRCGRRERFPLATTAGCWAGYARLTCGRDRSRDADRWNACDEGFTPCGPQRIRAAAGGRDGVGGTRSSRRGRRCCTARSSATSTQQVRRSIPARGQCSSARRRWTRQGAAREPTGRHQDRSIRRGVGPGESPPCGACAAQRRRAARPTSRRCAWQRWCPTDSKEVPREEVSRYTTHHSSEARHRSSNTGQREGASRHAGGGGPPAG